ncbi:MAG: uridine kinase [Bacteriovoracaceae bacterium]
MSYLIGIAGGSGSGKTTFAKKLMNGLEEHISLIHMDSYYNNELSSELFFDDGSANFDHPEAFDWPLIASHLTDLRNGQPIDCPIYDFKTNSRTNETERVVPKDIIILEGIYSLFDQSIREILNLSCFLLVDADIRLIRRLHRDFNERGRSFDSIIAQYYKTVRPMHKKYIEPQKDHADVIIGEENQNAVEVIHGHVVQVLKTLRSKDESSAPLQAH